MLVEISDREFDSNRRIELAHSSQREVAAGVSPNRIGEASARIGDFT